MKKGFTLVELSIVLVIIGLLIGGILAAQSMIETAKINSLVKQLSGFDIGVANFKTKYNSLPGDTTIFSPIGDGDGIIENSQTDALTFNHTGQAQDFEIQNFWLHLQQGGFLNSEIPTLSTDFSAGVKAGINVPKLPFGKGKPVAVILGMNNAQYKNYYYLCDLSKSTTTNWNPPTIRTPAFTPIQALAVDKKIDDGLAGRASGFKGIVFADNYNDGYTATGNGRCFTGDSYGSSDNAECCLQVKILREYE